MKILIVDDEAYLRDELKDSLERISPGNEYSESDHYEDAVKKLKENSFDIAFLDIRLRGKSGLEIAETAKRISPQTNLVMVTAYSEYALEAFKLFVSGYLLKPFSDNDLRDVLDHLRTPVDRGGARLEIRCFGNFEVFVGKKPMILKRSKEKELLAYLISLKGSSASKNEICATIFEDTVTPDKADIHFRQVFASLKKDLKHHGFEDVIVHNNNAYAIDTALVKCDYYDFITGKTTDENVYRGEFMNQYSWAEQYVYALDNF
ncbi:MAG: response regulator [Clostridia bacterium]|nr:response regulator [Clostridia bacterium]